MIKCVLTDIEGTTSSIEFVHKVLFPYSREHFHAFLKNSTDPEVHALVNQLWTEGLGHAPGSQVDYAAVTKHLQSLIDKDVKDPTLKALQGKIWKNGYEAKAYQGHVYCDVKPKLESWKRGGLRLGVYSSGSVEAQKLLFRFSSAGDLTKYFDSYFDTAVGGKRDARSYQTIAQRLDLEPSSILFLSDIEEELDAAATAGFKTCQLLRDPRPAGAHHPAHIDFDGVDTLLQKL